MKVFRVMVAVQWFALSGVSAAGASGTSDGQPARDKIAARQVPPAKIHVIGSRSHRRERTMPRMNTRDRNLRGQSNGAGTVVLPSRGTRGK